jgi:hypothetical protein
MSELISEFGKLNSRERVKGLLLAILAAVLALVWGALSPIVDNFVTTQTFDFSSFGAAVSLTTIWKAALASGLSYLGLTKYSGEKP